MYTRWHATQVEHGVFDCWLPPYLVVIISYIVATSVQLYSYTISPEEEFFLASLRLIAKEGLCTGCRICELVCSGEKNKMFRPSVSKIRIEIDEKYQEKIGVCRSCFNPVCVKSCPNNALKQVDNNGLKIIITDYDKCNGCGICITKCPFRAISINPDTKKPQICDLCNGRLLCAKACPTGALQVMKEV
jgi:Fe-S-cluster-containing hydrogenase component 2